MNPRSELSAEETVGGGRLYPLEFGSNHRPSSNGKGFTGERRAHRTLSQVTVWVLKAHRFDEPGICFWSRLRRLDFRDDCLRVKRVLAQNGVDFCASLAAGPQEDGATQGLLFLHGFNVSFEETAIRATQLGCDISVPGVTDFFSWPSHGSVLAHPADAASFRAEPRTDSRG